MGRFTLGGRVPKTIFCLISIAGLVRASFSETPQGAQKSGERLTRLNLEELGNVEVTTVSKEPEQLRRTPAAVFVLTEEDIRRSGAASIPEVLRLVPGVEVARIDSNQWSLGVRGFGSSLSRSVLVLIDGRSVYTPLFAGVFWNVQDTLLEDIDRIEVIRGPGGTIWGANAVNGVINIVTKNSADTQGVFASAALGTLDRTIDEVRYGGHGMGLNYRIFSKGFIRRPEFHSDGDNFDGWHQERGGFRMDWNRGKDSFMVEGDLYRGNSPHRIGTTNVNDIVSGGDTVARWQRNISTNSDLYFQTYFDRTIRIGSQFGET